jgi:Spy/CpxP family protein refolding chaperone
MKALHYFSTAVIALSLASMVTLNAQKHERQGRSEHKQDMAKDSSFRKNGSEIPSLTAEQKAKVKELRLAHFKEVQPLRNQLGELKAKQKTLTTAEKPDLKLINSNIDEITKVKNQLMKSREQNHQQIRALLTDEQRMAFDTHKGAKMKHKRGIHHWIMGWK